MKFAMYGSGAAGSVFASYLRKGGADIILIDRYEAHMKNCLLYTSPAAVVGEHAAGLK